MVFLILFSGCASFESSLERRAELFEVASRDFEYAVRWGYYEHAYDYIRNNGTDQKRPDFDLLRSIRVSTYEVLKSTISANELQAMQSLEIRYYHINTLVEKTLLHELRWEYDREAKKWQIAGEFPPLR
ncbi:MAG: hypothetical protein JSU90_09870 [Nitrospiraceae bacterium]|nr:MAG: hypothetical protein JSU90_09870 [Nitrospiraceae bacterium]